MCGALRAGSTNLMLLREAARVLAPEGFVEGDLHLPLYDGDLEDRGIPAPVLQLAEQVRAADAVIIACPEYNKALSGVMKNALDWLSRVNPAICGGTSRWRSCPPPGAARGVSGRNSRCGCA